MSDNIEFVDGLRIYAPRDNAPDYIVANGEIEVGVMESWCKQRGGKVRIVIKRAKSGKYYASVDNWKPTAQREALRPEAAPTGEFQDDDLGDVPF